MLYSSIVKSRLTSIRICMNVLNQPLAPSFASFSSFYFNYLFIRYRMSMNTSKSRTMSTIERRKEANFSKFSRGHNRRRKMSAQAYQGLFWRDLNGRRKFSTFMQFAPPISSAHLSIYPCPYHNIFSACLYTSDLYVSLTTHWASKNLVGVYTLFHLYNILSGTS